MRGMMVLGLALLVGPARAADHPHIVLVLCDDLGYGDVSCLNPRGKLITPHFDRVAREGMIFTDAHSASAVCTPTRYGLLTGRYAWRTRLQQGVLGGLSPRLIEPRRLTVARLLQQAGYHTACIGKWHLGMDWVKLPGKEVNELNIESREQVFHVDYAQPIANGPNSVGFDEYFGISASLDMVPYTFIHNDRVTVLPTEDRRFPLMLGRSDGMTREGPAAPGFDVDQVLPALTERAVAYIRQRAAAGQPFFLYLPYASPHTPIAPTPEWQGKSGLNPYGDFVLQNDACLGEVLRALDETGVARNTLLIVTSDNGCSPQAKFEELAAKGHHPSYVFRGTKADIYEGGHRVPFLVRWPAVVQAGSRTDRLTCLNDVFATCAEIVGAEIPPDAGGDSVSFLATLRGEERPRPAVVHHSINGSFAIREGQWKLALCPGSGGWSAPRPGRDDVTGLPPVQLFDLSRDIGEQHNLQAEHPDIVARLTQLLEKFVADGRSTPGPRQANAVAVDLYKAGREARQPPAKARKKASPSSR